MSGLLRIALCEASKGATNVLRHTLEKRFPFEKFPHIRHRAILTAIVYGVIVWVLTILELWHQHHAD